MTGARFDILASLASTFTLVACVGEPIFVGRANDLPTDQVITPVGVTIDARGVGRSPQPPHDECDLDLDGWESVACGGEDCDDRNEQVNPAALENEDWTVDVIAEDASLPALAVDGHGIAHAAFRSGSGDEASIAYATNISGTWLAEPVGALEDTTHTPSVSIGPNGRAHVCWTTFEDHVARLGYANNASGVWSTTLEEWIAEEPTRCSVAVDATGTVHLAYRNPALDALQHRTLGAGRWAIERVDGHAGAGAFPVLLLAGGYAPRIGYQDAEHNVLWAVRNDDVWQLEVVEGDFDRDDTFLSSFAVDGQGAAHVSYRAAGDRQLRYATNATGVWVYETIQEPGYTARLSAIGIDTNAFTHIVFTREERRDMPDDLLFATRAGGAWSKQVVDEEGLAGWSPSLIVGPVLLHVAYQRVLAGGDSEVVYASRAIPDGIDADCDGEW